MGREVSSKLIERKNSALVIIDAQEKLFPLMIRKEEMLKNIVKLIKFCRICKIPIILTEQYPKGLGRTIKEIREELKDVSPIEKTSFSCFGSKEFRKVLKRKKVNTLIIVGIEAHVCVLQTALEAPKNFRVYVIADAISSRMFENVEIGLQRMRDAGVIISSTEITMYELLKDARTSEFREARELLRT